MDKTDKRIFFEMTGRRLHYADFPADDETDEEKDLNVLLENLLGTYEIQDDEVDN